MTSTYQEFVKKHFHNLPDSMSAPEKIKHIAAMWREHKGTKTTTKTTKARGGVMSGAALDTQGSGFISSALEALGLGLRMKNRRK